MLTSERFHASLLAQPNLDADEYLIFAANLASRPHFLRTESRYGPCPCNQPIRRTVFDDRAGLFRNHHPAESAQRARRRAMAITVRPTISGQRSRIASSDSLSSAAVLNRAAGSARPSGRPRDRDRCRGPPPAHNFTPPRSPPIVIEAPPATPLRNAARCHRRAQHSSSVGVRARTERMFFPDRAMEERESCGTTDRNEIAARLSLLCDPRDILSSNG